MGDAAKRSVYEGKRVVFNLAAVPLILSAGDIRSFGRDDDGELVENKEKRQLMARVACAKVTITTAVNSIQPKMKRGESRSWRVWQEEIAQPNEIDENGEYSAEMTLGDIQWLVKLLDKDVELPTQWLMWIEQLADYLKAVKPVDEEEVAEQGDPAPAS
jgi:hypothetical protein